MKIFESYRLQNLELSNRMVMAPLTRSRAIDNIPNGLMATYYAMRAEAGLIITEGTAPDPNGLGYPRIPGIYNKEQVKGWKRVTDAVHARGGKIFVQLMHTGRVSHPLNMEEDARVIAPSPIAVDGEMYTDQEGPQPYPVPEEMSKQDISDTKNGYVQAAKNAMRAGFDGVELHGANGYLIEQFLNPTANHRDDEYGGSIKNRCRFAIEVAEAVIGQIGADKTGMRISPYGVFNDMKAYDDIDETYRYLATELGSLGLAYLHIVDHSSMGAPEVPEKVKALIRESFKNTIIISGGLDKESAETVLEEDKGELVAFGRKFLANPDLVYRFKHGMDLNEPDSATFYTPGRQGYIDYPVEQESLMTLMKQPLVSRSR